MSVAGTKMKADHFNIVPRYPTNHWAYEAVSDLSLPWFSRRAIQMAHSVVTAC